jgi:hypothetical protein
VSSYPGLLGTISEAAEIHERTGCSVEEAYRIQRRLADERMEQPPSNVIQFRPRGH